MRSLAPYIIGPILAIIVGTWAASITSALLTRAAHVLTLTPGEGAQ